nr:hypothetical protein GCM10020093_080210 [Planobispora longispora]
MTSSDPSISPTLGAAELTALRDRARSDYAELVERGLSLDLTRGKPSPDQLDLAAGMLTLPAGGHRAADGTDTRNYGGLHGLTELREIFSGLLQVPTAQLIAGGNSSLTLMHDSVVHAMLSPLPGAGRRWADEERIAFLCPVPGYDRHFALCERFGIELIPVPMTAEGPTWTSWSAWSPRTPRSRASGAFRSTATRTASATATRPCAAWRACGPPPRTSGSSGTTRTPSTT